jgi:hypothetical protein
MLRKIVPFFQIAGEMLRDIIFTFRTQALTRGYLLALAIFVIALLFSFLALSPVLYSFVYPLF